MSKFEPPWNIADLQGVLRRLRVLATVPSRPRGLDANEKRTLRPHFGARSNQCALSGGGLLRSVWVDLDSFNAVGVASGGVSFSASGCWLRPF